MAGDEADGGPNGGAAAAGSGSGAGNLGEDSRRLEHYIGAEIRTG